MNPHMKYGLKRWAARAGVSARSVRPQRKDLRQFCAHLRTTGFRPGVIIDVGVADGTFDIYTVFPEAHYLLVEPLEEFMPAMRWIARHYRAEIALAAAGTEDSEVAIHFGQAHEEMHGATVIPSLDPAPPSNLCTRTIALRRIDSLVGGLGRTEPILLKVDTQGSELDVVRGATGVLDRIEVIVLEVSLFNFGQAQPEMVEVVNFLSDLGYVPYDMFDGYNRPLDNALGQIDIAFVKADGRFRRDARFAMPQTRIAPTAVLMRGLRRALKV
jgi:FkbM family methyltransferase